LTTRLGANNVDKADIKALVGNLRLICTR